MTTFRVPSTSLRFPWRTFALLVACTTALAVTLPTATRLPEGRITFARSSGRVIDLYTLSLGDGSLQRHTQGPGTSTSPAWSPDGGRLAFARRADIPYSIWLLDLRSGTTTRLTHGTAIDGNPTWSPDGVWLAFASNRGPGAQFDLYLVSADGGSCPHSLVAGRSPAWSPVATQVAFERDGDLYLVSPETGTERRLTSTDAIDAAPAWAPDGRYLAFSRQAAGGSLIALLDTRDGSVRALTAGTDVDASPAWSPDGRWIAFSRTHDSGTHLYVLDVASGNEQAVTSSPLADVAPTWRPAG